jgi:hypothetical protein
MNIGEILIWESSNLLLCILAVIGRLVLTRCLKGRTVFTERDWLFLTGHPREKVFSLHSGSVGGALVHRGAHRLC